MAATAGGTNAGMLNLEKELICFICTEIMFQPLTLLDCLHSFCGSCVKSWFQIQHHKACSSHSTTPASANPYTCPTCRATVKAARPNAMVNTWLEIYLTANPSRGPSQEDKEEKIANYKPGDDILPKVIRGRRKERRSRRDEVEALERNMLEEARQRSIQEMHNDTPPRQDLLQPPTASELDQSSRSRDRDRDRDRERDERRARRREAERQRRHRVHVAETQATEQQDTAPEEQLEDSPPVMPPTTSPRHPDAVEARQRQQRVMHQASLVSLISSSEGSTGGSSMSDTLDIAALRDMILAEGLLDGIDINALTEAEENVLAERVAEAFRQRRRTPQQQQQQDQQQEQRQDHQVRTLAVSHPPTSVEATNLLPERGDRQRSRNRSASSQQRAHTVPTTTATNNHSERAHTSRILPISGTSTPPSASAVVAHRRRRLSNPTQSTTSTRTRSRQSSPARSSTRLELNSTAELSNPSQAQEASIRDRPARPETVSRTNTEPRSSPINSTSSLSQAVPGSSVAAVPAGPSVSSPRASIPELPGSGTHSPRSPSRTLSQSALPTLAHFDEPSVTCLRCYRTDIQYEVHKHCSQCNVDLCQRCYRKGRGCNHWFGFGNRALAAFEATNTDSCGNEQVELPHVLVGRSFRKPHQSLVLRSKMAKDGQTVIPLRTMSDPATRAQEGHFCDRCGSFANSCFWSCDWCNDGEWGFCKDCVNTHHCCTHPLLPTACRSSSSNVSRSLNMEGGLNSPGLTLNETLTTALGPTSPGLNRPTSATSAISAVPGPLPGYDVLNINTHCDVCGQSIRPTYLHYHCPSHQSTDPNTNKTLGDYDICTQCYHNLIKTNRIKRDDGPAGWRKCPLGHRMIITTFQPDSDGSHRRIVHNDLVGGWGLTDKDINAWSDAMARNRDSGSQSSPVVEPAELAKTARGTWRWREDQQSDKRTTRERGFSLTTVAPAPTTTHLGHTSHNSASSSSHSRFPPDGGFGAKRVARWAYYPDEGDAGQSELLFPRGAEIRELENVNDDWWSGIYAGDVGFVPGQYLWAGDGQQHGAR